jgi:hypothetical protein
MAAPGTIGNLVPPGEDNAGRKHEDLSREVKELRPSIMESILPLITDLQAQQAELEAQQADLAAQQEYLSSLISRDDAVGIFNTGTLTNDATEHFVGSQAVVSDLPIPTGKVRITISCSEASISPGTNAVVAAISYAIDGISVLDGSRFSRLYTVGNPLGASLVRVGTEELPPGTYTLRAQASYWSSGADAASINFSGVRLLTEVIGSD